MLLLEFVVIVVAFLINSLVFIKVYIYARESPIIELKLFSLALLAGCLFLLSWIPFTITSTTSSINPIETFLFKFGFLFLSLLVLAWLLAFLLPNMKLSYEFIIRIIVYSIVIFSFAVYTLSNFNISIINNVIYYQFDLVGIVLAASMSLLFVFHATVKIFEMNKLATISGIPKPSHLSLILFMGGWVSVLILGVLPTFLPVTIYFMFIPWIINAINIYISFQKNPAFFFITPIKFYGVIIVERQSGLTLYAKSYENDRPADELLGSLLTALNLSLQDSLKSTKSIENIIFGDKVITISQTANISSFLIVSDYTLQITSIATYISKVFSKQFQHLLHDHIGLNQDDFKSFDEEITKIKTFLPI